MVKKDQPMIIISSSGMVENGHSKSWAKALLPCKNDAIYFIGYCGKNTLGNKIQNEHTLVKELIIFLISQNQI